MFPGIGTVINTAAVVVGGGLGLLMKKGISERFQRIIYTATGTGTFFIGLTGVMSAALTAHADGSITSRWGMMLILSLVLGGVIGEALKLDKLFDRIGERLKDLFAKNAPNANFGTGFTMATILFCTGAMAILGPIEDVGGNIEVLMTKALLDGIMGMILATVYGVGVLFSALSVLVYQGLITIGAFFLTQYISPEVVSMMSLVGSAVIMLIGFSLWDIKKFNVANLLPAAFMPIILSWIPFLR